MSLGGTLTVNTSIPSGTVQAGGTIQHAMHHTAYNDGMDSDPSSPDSTYDESDLLHSSMQDDVAAQLAAAGPIGVAAAACIATGKKRKRPHSFETNPSIRKRQQTRLIRKLRNTIDEYTTRVGQQAIVLTCTPGKPSQSNTPFKVFGSQPLESVVRNSRNNIMNELESALAAQAPLANPDNTSMHELPPLNIDGLPTPVDKMTQAQLRAFIPEMLKYSTGRSKPGWGKPECRPIWWPEDVPWANVRSDVRTEEMKKRVSWTHALRTIVKNCYKHHGRDDLLPEFEDSGHQGAGVHSFSGGPHTMVQTISNPDGTVSIIQIDTSQIPADAANTAVVTLNEGGGSHIVHTVGPNQYLIPTTTTHGEANQAVQTLAEVATTQQDLTQMGHPISVQINQDEQGNTVAHIQQDGQIIIGDANTMAGGGDNQGSNLVTIPVSMYQGVVTNLQQITSSVSENSQQLDNSQVEQQPLEENTMEVNEQSQSIETSTIDNTEIMEESKVEIVPDATHAVEVMTVDTSSQ
ncbi:unnamed protein product [Owenia fusiformis]|nr:unnamed protein product [Owenia fusiformis]